MIAASPDEARSAAGFLGHPNSSERFFFLAGT
jgi:hypothetical protein